MWDLMCHEVSSVVHMYSVLWMFTVYVNISYPLTVTPPPPPPPPSLRRSYIL